MQGPRELPSDVVDVSDVLRTLQRQWRALVSFLVLGILAAIAILLFAPRAFNGKATVLARPAASSGGSILNRLSGNVGDLIGNVSGLGGGKSDFETELQVLKSRELASRLVDSLRLQFSPRDPRRVPPATFVASSELQRSFAPRVYRFERVGTVYRTEVGGQAFELTPGQPGRLDIGTVTLAANDLPPSFAIKVFDREDAITRLSKRLNVTKAGGDVAQVVYRGEDSLTAAAVPNTLVAFYLDRRRTTDRGVNARRVEYISGQMDSTAAQLAASERALRRYQEESGVLDAEMVGTAKWEGAVELRKSLTDIEVEAAAINQLIAQSANGSVTYRQLAAYPTFLRGSSISPMITQLGELDAQRIRLLERRTERDPEVIALDQSITSLESQILAMARSYANSVNKQRAELSARLDSAQSSLMALPAAQERGGRLQRDVARNSTIYAALQAQLVEARLGAIGEGGDIKQLDAAAPPRRPSFPQPLLTMGLGTAGGLVSGIIAALMMGWFGRSLRDPVEIERIAGVSAQRFLPDVPLLLLGRSAARTVLLVPLDKHARTEQVAERLVRTATARSLSATILDLSGGAIQGGNGNGAAPFVGRASIEALEQEHGLVVVRLPTLSSDTTLGTLHESRPVLLVAGSVVDRERLANTLEMLRRMDVPCAGVVIGDGQVPPRLGRLT